ncbi:MAG: hypothetical protein O2816_16375, partial [Planctomycetota bacterium]|nr:hypothetical protein [Planctomycetota bacterium]
MTLVPTLLAVLAPALPHDGPPFSVQLEVFDGGVLVQFLAEQQLVNGELGLGADERFDRTASAEIVEAAKRGMLELLGDKVALSIDGQAITPVPDAVAFYDQGFGNFE